MPTEALLEPVAEIPSTLPVEVALLNVLESWSTLPEVMEVEAIVIAVCVVSVSQFQVCAKFALARAVGEVVADVKPDNEVPDGVTKDKIALPLVCNT